MALEFDIQGYEDSWLTPPIYVVQTIWCLLVLLPLSFVVRCWIRFVWARNIRTAFTIYMSGIDSASRLIFLAYYLLRLAMIYKNNVWMVIDQQGYQSVINRSCRHPFNATECPVNLIIDRSTCLWLSLPLYWASLWPMSSFLLLQTHALVASIIPERYERFSSVKFCCFTMIVVFGIDFVTGIAAFLELREEYSPEALRQVHYDRGSDLDGCKFEYFSRLSLFNSWQVTGLVLAIGVMALIQLGVSISHKRQRKSFVNTVANSPVQGWTTMTSKQRRTTVAILVCGTTSFLLFIVHFIVYLVEGNSLLRQFLSITISVFAFFGPIELMWFNVDVRRAIFIIVLGEKYLEQGAEKPLHTDVEKTHSH